MCAPLSPPPLFLCLTLSCSLAVYGVVFLFPHSQTCCSPCFCLTLLTLPLRPPPLRASPWLGSQLLSPQTPHIPALPWLPACIPGHGDSMGSHNPRQLADLGWASDSQKRERRGTEGLRKDRVRGGGRRGGWVTRGG